MLKLYLTGTSPGVSLAGLHMVDSPDQADVVIAAASRNEILDLAGSIEDTGRRTVVVSDFSAQELGLLQQEGLEALTFCEFDRFMADLAQAGQLEEAAAAAAIPKRLSLEQLHPVPTIPFDVGAGMNNEVCGLTGGGQVIPVGSTAGGVGKSTMAVNLAVWLSRFGPTVLVDFDAYHGDVPLTTYLDRPAPVTVTGWDPNMDLMRSPRAANLGVLPFTDPKKPRTYLAGEGLGVDILTTLKARFDYVVVDLGVFADLWCITAAVRTADLILLVVDQSHKCLVEMTSFIHLESTSTARAKMRLLLNMVGLSPIHTPDEIRRALAFGSHHEVPFDQTVSKAIIKQMFPVMLPKSPAGRAMREAFGDLFGRRDIRVPWYKRLFSRRVAG